MTAGGDTSRDAPARAPERAEEYAPGEPNGQVPPWLRRTIALFFVWAAGVAVAYWLVVRLRGVLLMVLAAGFLALAMEPPVNYLAKRRGWRRGAATGFVMLILFVVGVVFVGAILSILVQEVAKFVDDAPRYIRDIETFLNDDLGFNIDAKQLIRDLQRNGGPLQNFADDLAGGALDVTGTVLALLLQIVTVLVFAFYLTADGPRLRRAICSLVPPKRQRTVLDTWELAIDKTGGYLYSRGLQAVVSAFATWAVLFALDVPYALALGLWVGVVSQFVPTIGTYIAMILPVTIAAIHEPINGAFVLGFLLLYQQFENYVLGPRITARTMDVHPAIAIGTVFVGAALIGPIGAVLALPATAVIQGVVSAYGQRYEVIETDLTKEHQPRGSRRVLRLRRRTHSEVAADSDR
jgi:predicted PurR-regulated permease PerM